MSALIVWLLFTLCSSPKNVQNVLLISIDTCRADHLSCYGYKHKTTPNIDALASKGILFENAYTPVPLTLPAHSSMLTGTLPTYHGIHDNFDSQLGKSNVTLAEILKGKGLTTGGIVAASILNSQFGISQGFDSYNDRFDKPQQLTKIISERKGDEVNHYALKWLDENNKKPFFLFLHYYDAHDPYRPPEPFAGRFANKYAGEIAYVDNCIGEVINKLKKLNLYDSTLIIITGDHGEMLGEHDEEQHGYFIYQAAIKVPLVLKLPGRHKSKRIAEQVSLVDIVPTVCNLFKADVPPQVKGINLLGKSDSSERYLYCETLTATKYKANSLLGIIAGNFKYIQTTRPELYDIVKDPGESVNLAAAQPQRVRILQDHLKQIFDEQFRKENSESDLSISDETRKTLESLGYVGGKVSAEFGFDQSKDDPKDLINFHNKFANANNLRFNKKYLEAKKLYRSLITQRPQVVELYSVMADIAKEENDFINAVAYLNQVLKLDPNNYKSQNDLGISLAKLGKLDEAAEYFKKSLQINPDQFEAHNGLASIYDMQHNYSQAIIHFSESLHLNYDQPKVREQVAAISINQGNLYMQQSNLDGAIKCYEKAAELKPDTPQVHSNLGMMLIRQRKFEDAISHLEIALKLNPKLTQAHYNLIDALVQKRELDRASVQYKKFIEHSPEEPDLLYKLAYGYFSSGEIKTSLEYWKKVLEIKPNWPEALNNLAWIKATCKGFQNPDEAVRIAQQVCESVKFKNPFFLDTLSIAYASAGEFEFAIETAKKALDIANASGQKSLAIDIENHIRLFKNKQSYTQPLNMN